MIICSSCKHSEILGSLFCSECGAQLDTSAGSITDAFESPFGEERGKRTGTKERPVQAAMPVAALVLPAHETAIQLRDFKEYSVGRVSEGQKVLPDIDLSPYDGFNNGVSRLHAEIIVADGVIEVKDLGSSNGSVLNNQKLIPHVPYRLNDGDVLIFGKLITRILLNS